MVGSVQAPVKQGRGAEFLFGVFGGVEGGFGVFGGFALAIDAEIFGVAVAGFLGEGRSAEVFAGPVAVAIRRSLAVVFVLAFVAGVFGGGAGAGAAAISSSAAAIFGVILKLLN